MKKLLPSLIVTSLIFIFSANTSFSQQTKERTKAELNTVKTQEVKIRIEKAYLKQYPQEKKTLKAKPVKTRVRMKAEPAQIKLNKSKM